MIKDSVSGRNARQPPSSIEAMMRRLPSGSESQNTLNSVKLEWEAVPHRWDAVSIGDVAR